MEYYEAKVSEMYINPFLATVSILYPPGNAKKKIFWCFYGV